MQIDAGPFKTWCASPHLPPRPRPRTPFPTHSRYHSPSSFEIRYQAHYGVDLGKQVAKKDGVAAAPAEVKKSKSVLKKATAVKARGDTRVIDKVIFVTHLVACLYYVFVLQSGASWFSFMSLARSFFCPLVRQIKTTHTNHAFDTILFFEVSNLNPFPPTLQSVEEQFKSGRLYARISSRPGQSGRCDGCVLPRYDGFSLLLFLNV